MTTSTPALRRADSAIGKYKTNHPYLQQRSTKAETCGRCLKPTTEGSTCRVLGRICPTCTTKAKK